jgi:predicted alpha/beta-fold hydrolase
LISPLEAYRSPRWLRGGHAQTIYPAMFLRGAQPRYRRERWDTPDGDFIDLDFLDGGPAAAPARVFQGTSSTAAVKWQSPFPRDCSHHELRSRRDFQSL